MANDQLRLVVKRVPNASKNLYSLYTEDGVPLPGITGVTIESSMGDFARLRVDFIVDHNNIRIRID